MENKNTQQHYSLKSHAEITELSFAPLREVIIL